LRSNDSGPSPHCQSGVFPVSGTAAAAGVAAAAVASPVVCLSLLLLMLGGAGTTPAVPPDSGCAGAGTGQILAGVSLTAEQLGNARTIVTVVADRHLPVAAAVIAVDVALTESSLHNSTVQIDHDSEGLFQQRVRFYTAAVAANPVRATGAFLDRMLAVPDWQQLPVGVLGQTVQRSAHPDRYQPNVALARQLVGELWPQAAASAAGIDPAAVTGAAECPGAGGVAETAGGPLAGRLLGPVGDTIAGTTTIPAGLILDGTPAGNTAARYALAQLGKPYVWTAAGPDAFDCSGLTMAAWAAAGVALPHHAADQISYGTAKPLSLVTAVSGDLVFIPGADGTPTAPGHVGIVAGYTAARGGRHLYVVQAPETGVPIEATQATEWSGQIVYVRHIG